MPHGTDRACKVAARRGSLDEDAVGVDAVFLRVFADMDDRGGHIGERARKERLRLTDGVSQNERIESLSHEVNCDRVALIGRKLAESAAGKDDHRGAASGEDVRGQRHVGTCGIEDNGFCFHLVKFLSYEDARADVGASGFHVKVCAMYARFKNAG